MLDRMLGWLQNTIAPTAHPDALRIWRDELLMQSGTPEHLDFIEQVLKGTAVPDEKWQDASQLAWFRDILWPKLFTSLHEHDRLTYDLLKTAILNAGTVPYCLQGQAYNQYRNYLDSPQHYCYQQTSPETYAILRGYMQRLAGELVADFTPKHQRLLIQMYDFPGSHFLLQVVAYHAANRAPKLKQKETYMTAIVGIKSSDDDLFKAALVHVARHTRLDDDEHQTLVEQLKQYPEKSLKALLPFAQPEGKRALCAALGWDSAALFVCIVSELGRRTFHPNHYTVDIPNSPEPASGTVDVAALRAALEPLDDARTKEIIKLYRQSGLKLINTLKLLNAFRGVDREKIVQGVAKHNQVAIKAYGLLPLERGANEVYERYLLLKESAKEGKKFGSQRRLTHAGAVQAALNNLAQLAGYADAGWLEWDMEARLAQEAAPDSRVWTAGDYELRIAVEDTQASITVSRDGKALKSVPQAVRQTAEYAEVKELVGHLRNQASRIRTELLENLLVSGDLLDRAELESLLRLPAARAMMQQLIWRTDTGRFGLFDADLMILTDLAGDTSPIDEPIGLAHPYHLFHADALAAWQREIVRRRIAQPFKQAYRELYLLTPAELETRTFSNRFAGHVIDGAVTGRLFSSRGWRIESGEAVQVNKTMGAYRASFDLPDAIFFLTSNGPITTDRIYFEEANTAHYWGRQDTWLPLDEVPPLIFSEIMRDADLAVSVGQRQGEARVSNEIMGQRANLVIALLDDLGLSGVTIDGHFAYVQGKLAKYRVHLGSAVIHIEPGNYLCIVPERWGMKHEKLFLPFADERDAKISEVISKILLLLADDRIKDESILRQIRRNSA